VQRYDFSFNSTIAFLQKITNGDIFCGFIDEIEMSSVQTIEKKYKSRAIVWWKEIFSVILQPQNVTQRMNKYTSMLAASMAIALFASCGDYNALLKNPDTDARYEAAKQYFYDGNYNRASTLLLDLIAVNKGTEKGQESLYLLALANFKAKNYDSASEYFKKYYESYPKGYYAEDARLLSGLSLYMNTPEPILDQTDTYKAITEFSNFIEVMPNSKYRNEATDYIFKLQDKLIEKEYAAAKLYYDLGTYFGNCTEGGSNYQACIVTAQNAINDYPYSERREDFAILILRSKFDLAEQSIEAKRAERYQSAAEEYYSFQNEYPESKFMKKADDLFKKAQPYLSVETNNN